MLDFNSLLLAAALSGTCLSAVLAAVWIANRDSRYIVLIASGIAVLVAHLISLWRYSLHPNPWLCALSLALLMAGFGVVYAATAEYIGRRGYLKLLLPGILLTTLLSTALVYVGLDGAAFVGSYCVVVVLLFCAGANFWSNGRETHGVLVATSLLSGIAAVSFALCALVLVVNGQWALGVAPNNWAERLNSAVVIACMTALGVLTMSLHHIQAAVRLRADAATDPLTGLLNRRGMEGAYGDTTFGVFSAIVMFDLDNFKRTNDVFGHLVGDEVLRHFGASVTAHMRDGDMASRLGGEEFVLVMQHVSEEKARAITEKICATFAEDAVTTRLGAMRNTVSAGIAFGRAAGLTLSDMLAGADKALYEAKRTGRNRVVSEEIRKAG
jgi:diguanylate cyclase (GGDEF)-like protein